MYPYQGHQLDRFGDADRAQLRPIAALVAGNGAGAGAGESDTIPETGDWRGLGNVVLDQARSEACVWHGVAMALYMRGLWELWRGTGPGVSMPSVMQPWVLAQWSLQQRMGMPPAQRYATNAGSVLSVGLEALRTFGIVAAGRWPLDPRLLRESPAAEFPLTFDMPVDVDLAASCAKLTGDYGASGPDFPMVARAALAQGHFPVQAFDVCDRFLALTASTATYEGPGDRKVIGRHMMVVVGWRPGWLLYRNSYGRDWGDDGHVWISDAYTASDHARDGAVLTATPNLKD